MKTTIQQYTMSDTGEVFEFPGCEERIYELKVTIAPIDNNNGNPNGLQKYSIKPFHLHESTLQKAGMVAFSFADLDNGAKAEETPEDLLIRLLESVGVWEEK